MLVPSHHQMMDFGWSSACEVAVGRTRCCCTGTCMVHGGLCRPCDFVLSGMHLPVKNRLCILVMPPVHEMPKDPM